MKQTRIMFVCTGNICRSPLAEAYFRHAARRRGVEDRFYVDSSGLDADHIGETADPRMVRTARKHGVTIDHRAKRFRPSEVKQYDLVVVMDRGHLRRLTASVADPALSDRIVLFRDYDPRTTEPDDVPDPWYGGIAGFERVYDIVQRTVEALLDHLIATQSATA